MMSLNLKLQSSASKSLARSIELEIRKIEARECKELLSIVQVCCPSWYRKLAVNHALAISTTNLRGIR